MACGWTPELMKMLESMGDEKQRLAAEAKKQMEHTAEEIEKRKKRSEEAAVCGRDGRHDWTAVYEKWDTWEDPEELAQREQAAREKQERAARAAAQAGCNHDHSAEQKLMDMTTDAKLLACDEFRVLGNRFFSQGQYQRAAYNYHKALVYFEYIFPDTSEDESRFDALKLSVLLNFTACRLRTGHLDDAIHHADLALQLDPSNAKALYRRAQAYRLRDEFDRATKDIDAALEASSDPRLVQEKQLLQAKMLAYKLRSKQVSAAMFGGKRDKSSKTTSRVADVPLLLHKTRAGINGDDQQDTWRLDESWRPNTSGRKELRQLLDTL